MLEDDQTLAGVKHEARHYGAKGPAESLLFARDRCRMPRIHSSGHTSRRVSTLITRKDGSEPDARAVCWEPDASAGGRLVGEGRDPGQTIGASTVHPDREPPGAADRHPEAATNHPHRSAGARGF